MLILTLRHSFAIALLLGVAALGTSSAARADDSAETPLPELPPPAPAAHRAEPEPGPAEPEPHSDTAPARVETRAEVWERKHRQNFAIGLETAGVSYAVVAAMGVYARLSSIDSLSRTWGTALFVPVGGPAYVGGRLIADCTEALSRNHRATAVALSPLVYGVGLFLVVDGVMQAYGLVRATGIGEGARPGGRSSDTTRTLHNVWVAPSAAAHGGELHVGASF